MVIDHDLGPRKPRGQTYFRKRQDCYVSFRQSQAMSVVSDEIDARHFMVVQMLLANVVHVAIVKLLRKCCRYGSRAAVLSACNIGGVKRIIMELRLYTVVASEAAFGGI
jgi:hypothetical protein